MSWSNFDNSVQNEGGFMDTSTADTTTQGDDKGNVKRGQNCIPVMIGHLNKYGDKLKVWGTPAKIVTFVAIVRKCEQASTKVSYEFQDDTGTIKGIKWLEEKSSFDSPVQVDSYARVYGMCREQNETNYVMIVNMQPIEDLNEILTHQMEVTLVALQGEKGSSSKGNQTYTNGMNQSTQGNQMMNGTDNASGLNSNQQLILEIIQSTNTEFGAERDDIKARVPAHLSSKVDDIIDFLQQEGHIYTTKTDDFFKAI